MAPRMPRVYLIRHGETEWSINGRHTGVSDIPLTANGEEIMKRNAPIIVGKGKLLDPDHLRHVIVSPRLRAQRTAELLFSVCSEEDNAARKASWETTEEVGEWQYGAYEGMLTKDIRKIQPNWMIWTDGCPSDNEHTGESPKEMSDRVDRVIAKIRALHLAAEQRGVEGVETECDEKERRRRAEAADVLVVSHGHFSRCFIARWIGLPLTVGTNFSTDPGGVTLLGYQHGTLKEPSVLGVNWYTEPK